jgi:two-component system sensor histidine kinase and response regulator WspE
VRPLDHRLGKVPNISSAAILDDGSPVLIADVEDMIRSAEELIENSQINEQDSIREPIRMRIGRKRVLIIEDSVTVREVERQILQDMGHEVVLSVDGQDGWNRLQAGDFDLIVSDIDMPRMNGFEVLRLVRGDVRFMDIPVIMVSYKDRPEDRQLGLELGVNYFLTKSSFHDKSFINAVQEALSN